MKGTFSIKDGIVYIEEFFYPLKEFLIDEPDIKPPGKQGICYTQGETIKPTNVSKTYTPALLDRIIARKAFYKAAHKARGNLTSHVVAKEPTASKSEDNKSQKAEEATNADN